MLVQAFYIFFATPILLKMVFNADIRIDVFTASLITLTLNAGAYMSEIFRGAIESVNTDGSCAELRIVLQQSYG